MLDEGGWAGATLRVFGYCDRTEAQLARLVAVDGPDGLRDQNGEYVIVVERPGRTALVSSTHGFHQYFYQVADGVLHHGRTVLDVLRSSRTPLRWDPQTVADVLWLEHPLGDETLSLDVRRVPPATVMVFADGRLTTASRSWDELHPEGRWDAEDCLRAHRVAVARWAGEAPGVCLTAGFDSRVLLSTLLQLGHRPVVATMGFEDSTDVTVSRAIIERFGLEWVHVELDPDDYLTHARAAVELTSGTKPAKHWHSFVFPRRAGLGADRPVFIGTNGEYVRSDYLNLGFVSRLSDMVPGAVARRAYWAAKSAFPLGQAERALLSDDVRQRVEVPRWERASRLAGLTEGPLLESMDRFYTTERVHAFHSNGSRLMSASFAAREPFLDRDWVSLARGLPRAYKLGSGWHRYAIERNEPRLLDFPISNWERRAHRRAPPLYWVAAGVYAVKPYAAYGQWFRSERLLERLAATSAALASVMDPRLVAHVVDEQRARGGRTAAVSVLLALGLFAELGREHDASLARAA